MAPMLMVRLSEMHEFKHVFDSLFETKEECSRAIGPSHLPFFVKP
jgi:hypothetical protein